MKPSVISFLVLARKECHRVLRMWTQTILPSVVTMTLYFLIFGHFVGRYIDSVGGLPFIEFLTPGLIMLAAITCTYANTCTSLFMEKFQRSIETMLIAPISHTAFLWGFLCGGVCRGLLVAVITSLIASYFTILTFDHLFILFFGLFFILLSLSLAGFINGLFAKKWDDVALVPTFVITPLTYLGGVFYSIDQMSEFWRTVSLFNPVVYIVNIFRYGMIGSSSVNITVAFSVLIIVTAVLYAVAMMMLRSGYGLRE